MSVEVNAVLALAIKRLIRLEDDCDVVDVKTVQERIRKLRLDLIEIRDGE